MSDDETAEAMATIEGLLKALELQVDLLLGNNEQLAAACEEAASFYATMMGEDSLAEDMPLLTAAVSMIRATGPRGPWGDLLAACQQYLATANSSNPKEFEAGWLAIRRAVDQLTGPRESSRGMPQGDIEGAPV